METLQVTLAEFLAKYPIGFKTEQVSFRPDSTWDAYHYLIRLQYGENEIRTHTLFYSMGKGLGKKCPGYNKYGEFRRDGAIKAPVPTLANVLESLRSDCQFGELTRKEMLSELGDSTGWEDCRKTRDAMIDLLGRAGYNALGEIEFDE